MSSECSIDKVGDNNMMMIMMMVMMDDKLKMIVSRLHLSRRFGTAYWLNFEVKNYFKACPAQVQRDAL